MKKALKIRFTDFSNGMRIEDRPVYKIIARHFDIDQGSNPDFIVCGTPGLEHFRYQDSVKIFLNGENIVPDFNLFDYATGFDHISFDDRYLRVPLYALYERDYTALVKRTILPAGELLNRDFCSFVVSYSGGDPIRQKFFEALSKYKKVDSGGRWMNNIGGPVSDKSVFLRSHKFNIAFENSSSPGYVTEKLMQALSAQTVPIYFGAPDVEKDFLPGSFVRVRGEQDIPRAIEEIKRLDQDDSLYLKMATATWKPANAPDYLTQLETFLLAIFSQGKERARRRNIHGAQAMIYSRLARWATRYSTVRKVLCR